MSKIVLLKIGDGDFKTGFSVNLRIKETGKITFERDGRLDPAPHIQHLYQDWRNVYVHRRMLHYRKKDIKISPPSPQVWGESPVSRGISPPSPQVWGESPVFREISPPSPQVWGESPVSRGISPPSPQVWGESPVFREISPPSPQIWGESPVFRGNDTYRTLTKIEGGTTRFSIKDSGQELELSLDRWLGENNVGFRPIREALLDRLNQSDTIRFTIAPREGILWQLPWHLCELFHRYPHSDVTLGSPDNPLATIADSTRSRLKILVLLGKAEELDVEADLQLLRDRLPKEAELAEPLIATNRETLNEALWQQDIDILFFAGHSTSQGSEGRFFLNETDSIAIADLKYALQQAIDRGLKLAIFNSCDGVKLAQELAEIKMPAIVVMREPVPDEAAQRFLEYFLEAFAEKKEPLYKAVREARERLHGLEEEYPCASWLPVLYQHPAAEELTWTGMLRSPQEKAIEILPTLKIPRLPYLAAAITTSFVFVGGWMGAMHLSQYLTEKGIDCSDNYEIECATRNFDWALILNPNNARVFNEKGLIAESLQDLSLARRYFQQAKRKGYPPACNNEARIDNLDKKYERAENLLIFCLPQVSEPIGRYSMLKNLGWALFGQGKYNGAEEKLLEAIAIQGMRQEGPANCLLAMTLEAQANIQDTLKEWQYCRLYAKDTINEERDWKETAEKRINELEELKQ